MSELCESINAQKTKPLGKLRDRLALHWQNCPNCQQHVLVMHARETRYEEKFATRKYQKMWLGSQRRHTSIAHCRHGPCRISRENHSRSPARKSLDRVHSAGVHTTHLPNVFWLPQEAPNNACSSLPFLGHVNDVQSELAPQCRLCIAPPLAGATVFLGCSPGASGVSSIWFQTLCCVSPLPLLSLSSSLSSLSPPLPRNGCTSTRFALDNQRHGDGDRCRGSHLSESYRLRP